MPHVIITREAEDAIRACADAGFEPAPANADGTRAVWLGDDTVAHIANAHLRGESLSDTIIRLLALAGRGTH
jgi:hypothetical protein